MSIICKLIGHRWVTFNAEQCPLEYRECKRCGELSHHCNTLKWGDHKAIRKRVSGGAL